jgi:hypothetical protein
LADGEEEISDERTTPSVLKSFERVPTDSGWKDEGDDDDIDISSYLSRSKALASKRVKRNGAGVAEFGAIIPNRQNHANSRADTNLGDAMVLSNTLEFASMVGAKASHEKEGQVDGDDVRSTGSIDEPPRWTSPGGNALTQAKDTMVLSNTSEFAHAKSVKESSGQSIKALNSNGKGSCLSVADTLKFLRQAGDLSTKKKEVVVGRPNDKKFVDPGPLPNKGKSGAKEIVLEYRDDQGRLLTPKEAFRQLSYKFHGIEPSKRTQEKRSDSAESGVLTIKLKINSI